MEESIARAVYTEVHIKTSLTVAGWVRSSNALSGATLLTKRFSGVSLTNIKSEVLAMGATASNVKFETALIDTNPELDAWWLRPEK